MRFNSTASHRFSLLVCLAISIILCEISKIMENSVIFFSIGIAEVTERAPDSRVFCTRGPRTPTVPNCRHRSDSVSATTTSRASNIWSFRSTTPPNCRRACGTTPVSIWKSPANRQFFFFSSSNLIISSFLNESFELIGLQAKVYRRNYVDDFHTGNPSAKGR